VFCKRLRPRGSLGDRRLVEDRQAKRGVRHRLTRSVRTAPTAPCSPTQPTHATQPTQLMHPTQATHATQPLLPSPATIAALPRTPPLNTTPSHAGSVLCSIVRRDIRSTRHAALTATGARSYLRNLAHARHALLNELTTASRSTRCCWSASPSAASGATAATTCACSWATAPARSRHGLGGARRGRGARARRARRSGVSGRYTVHPRFGPQINLRGLEAAAPGSFDPRRPARRPRARGRADGRRGARAARHDPGAAPAHACWSACSARTRELWAGYRVGAGGQVLPPGLPPRSARAQPRRRAGGQRDQRHLPGHRPRRGGHGRAAARHRQARGLHRGRSAAHRPDRRRAGCTARSRSATTASAA
jgi:hypothetical protein